MNDISIAITVKFILNLAGVQLTPDFEKLLNPNLSEAERAEILMFLQSSEHFLNLCRQVVISLRYTSLTNIMRLFNEILTSSPLKF